MLQEIYEELIEKLAEQKGVAKKSVWKALKAFLPLRWDNDEYEQSYFKVIFDINKLIGLFKKAPSLELERTFGT